MAPVAMATAQPPHYLRLVVETPRPRCPKCDTEYTGDACARCGLATAFMSRFQQSRDAKVSDELVGAWSHAQCRWNDRAVHDHLLERARHHQAYPWLAARYRERARQGDQIACERLALVQRTVELTLLVPTRDASDEARPYRGASRLLLVLLVLFVLGGVALHMVSQRGEARARPDRASTRSPAVSRDIAPSSPR